MLDAGDIDGIGHPGDALRARQVARRPHPGAAAGGGHDAGGVRDRLGARRAARRRARPPRTQALEHPARRGARRAAHRLRARKAARLLDARRPRSRCSARSTTARRCCRGQEPGPSADLDALGCVVFECLAGKPAGSGASACSRSGWPTLGTSLRIPGAERADALPALGEVTLRALAKEPSERPPSATVYAEAVDSRRGIGMEAAMAHLVITRPARGRRIEVSARAGHRAGERRRRDPRRRARAVTFLRRSAGRGGPRGRGSRLAQRDPRRRDPHRRATRVRDGAVVTVGMTTFTVELPQEAPAEPRRRRPAPTSAGTVVGERLPAPAARARWFARACTCACGPAPAASAPATASACWRDDAAVRALPGLLEPAPPQGLPVAVAPAGADLRQRRWHRRRADHLLRRPLDGLRGRSGHAEVHLLRPAPRAPDRQRREARPRLTRESRAGARAPARRSRAGAAGPWSPVTVSCERRPRLGHRERRDRADRAVLGWRWTSCGVLTCITVTPISSSSLGPKPLRDWTARCR